MVELRRELGLLPRPFLFEHHSITSQRNELVLVGSATLAEVGFEHKILQAP